MIPHALSVVIRVKNEADYIGRCIQSCIDILPVPLQIVIVDNCSTDDSLKVAKLFKHDTSLPANKSYCDIDICTISEYSPGSALNLGISLCKHQNILVISSHCELLSFDPELLNSVSNYAGIFGLQVPFYSGKRIKQNYIWSHFIDHDVVNMKSSLEDRYFFHNGLALFSNEFISNHLFNTELVGKEDRYWAVDVISEGFSTLYTPSFSAKHHYTPNGNTWKGIG